MNYELQTIQTTQMMQTMSMEKRVKNLSSNQQDLFKDDCSQPRAGETKMENSNNQIKTRKIVVNQRNYFAKVNPENVETQTNFQKSKIIGGLLMLLLMVAAVFAQDTKNTDYSPDKSLKSNARVNPSTLAMELSVPIAGYPGRAGNSLPVSFDYSSKVWEVQFVSTWESQYGLRTDTRPVYAKRSAGGWSSNLGSPRIDYKFDLYDGSDNPATQNGGYIGQIHSEDPNGGFYTYNLYSLKRLHVEMPNGSSHEFRADDTVNLCGTTGTGCAQDLPGTYLSVDGSKMRLEMNTNGTATLYLPDGSFYGFEAYSISTDPKGHQARTYTDRHGNKMTYNAGNKQWTDTLERVVTNPFPINWGGTQEQTVGDVTASFPGFNGGTVNATFSWRYLKDPNGGESGLSDTSQTLHNLTTTGCQGNISRAIPSPHLFQGSLTNTVRVCNPISFQGQNWSADPPFNPVVLTKITLANGQSYQFKYNVYGEIEKVIYPSGGYERFAYAAIEPVQISSPPYDQANRGIVDRWVSAKGDGTDEQHWTYSASRGTAPNYTAYKVTTTNPDGTRTEQYLHDENDPNVHRPYGFDNQKTGRPYETRSYSSANQLLRRTLTKYEVTGAQTGGYSGATRDIRPIKEVSLAFEPNASSALASMSETIYDTNSDAQYFASLNPKQAKTYHYVAVDLTTAQTANIDSIAALFSSSNLANTSETDYLYDGNYKARNIVTLPVETRVKDASGNVVAKSQIAYDEGSYPIISAGTDQMWTDPNTSYRANPTTARSWTDIGANQYVETHAQFDNFGNLRKAWDAKGNVSETEYSSTYKYAYPTKVITSVPDTTGANGSATAFETTSVYDLTTGLPTSTVDANGQTTQMEYNDSLLRPTKIIPPSAGGQTVMEYVDTPNAVSVKTKTQIDATNWAESTVYADGIGRAVKTEKKDNAGNVFVETEYDNMGRVKRVTNPYRNGETKLWTENTYDDLSRVTKVQTPDNAEVNTSFDLSVSVTLGTVVTVTDQAGKTRRSLTNALGQLARVDEPDDSNNLGAISSPNQATSYAYDTLNNLTTVSQGAQTRTFAYDSLSRLKQAINPESGTISYAYDANGNLTTKTDAGSIVTTYAYDNLNRVKARTYSDATPAVSYNYDGTGLGSVPNFSKGKLTKVSSSISETKYDAFDNVGKVLTSRQLTDGQTYGFAYAYNLGGMLTEETYPSGRKVKNMIDTDASLAKVETQPTGGSYATRAESFAYTAAGAVSSMQLGNGKWETAQFNSRLQPTQLGLGTSATDQSLWKVNYDYTTNGNGTDNNGNVRKQTITATSINPLVQTYDYDSLNRLKSATETSNSSQTWKQTFQYDRYGNRNFDTNNTTTLGSCPPAQCNPTIDAANNRFTTGQGYTYDLSGNVTADAQGRTFVYDAENKQKEIKDASNNSIGKYFYDGDGKRVKKVSAQETTLFVYDASGKLAAEYLMTTATPQTPTTSYLTTDTLGSPRVITDQSGNVTSRRDFMPFGEEIANLGNRTAAIGYQTDSTRQKFTGYERDSESDLDFAQARYFDSGFGRFTSPDYFVNDTHVREPQSWNLYTYARNNPLNRIDPLGKKAEVKSTYDKKTNTTRIKIKASFAIYGAAGQNVSKETMANFKKSLEDGVKSAWNTKNPLAIDGQNYEITTEIDVNTFGSESEALESGADNLVELGTQDLINPENQSEEVLANVFHRNGENVDRMLVDTNAVLSGGNSWENVFAHEFAHLLGENDNASLFSLLNGRAIYPVISKSDFETIFGNRGPDTDLAPRMSGGYYPPSYRSPADDWQSNILGSRNPNYELRYSRGPEGIYWGKRVQR